MSAAPITASAPITTSENEANASEWSMPSTYMSLETTPGSAVETTSSLMSLLSNPTTYDALPPVSSGSVPTADSSLSLERILEQAAQIVADSSNTTTRESSSAANTQFRDPSSTFNAQDNNVSKGGSLSSMSSLATLFLPEQSAEASGAEESGVLSLSMMAHAPPAAQREQEYCPMNDATEESLEAAQSAPDAQSPTEETAAGGTKRKRVSRACDICWKKKTKCINSHQSACDNCRQNGFTCTYFRDSKRRGPKALNPFDKDLTNREVMEDSIQQQMSLYETDVVVPVWDLIDLYYTYMHPIHPIIPKDIFMEHVWNESPILLLAMYASACRYRHALKQTQTDDPEVHAQLVAEDFEEGTRYYKQARLKIDRFLDVPCLQTILALRLLGNFAISVGEGYTARVFFGMAITMAKDLNLNDPFSSMVRLCPHWPPHVENEIKHRIWWTCFFIDIKSSCATFRPCSISFSMCRVPFPYPDSAMKDPTEFMTPNEEHAQIAAMSSHVIAAQSVPLKGEQAHMLSLLRLHRLIHEFHLDWELSIVKSPEERDHRRTTISQLDQALRLWFDCLPVELKNLSPDSFAKGQPVQGMPWTALFLHLLYQTAVVLLHKDLVKRLSGLLANKRPLNQAISESGVMTCLLSLQSVTSLLYLALQVNPDFLFIPTYAGYCTYQTGLVHAELAKCAPATPLAAQHTNFLDIHISALLALGKFWVLPGSKMATLLNEVRESIRLDLNKTRARTVSGVQPSSATTMAHSSPPFASSGQSVSMSFQSLPLSGANRPEPSPPLRSAPQSVSPPPSSRVYMAPGIATSAIPPTPAAAAPAVVSSSGGMQNNSLGVSHMSLPPPFGSVSTITGGVPPARGLPYLPPTAPLVYHHQTSSHHQYAPHHQRHLTHPPPQNLAFTAPPTYPPASTAGVPSSTL